MLCFAAIGPRPRLRLRACAGRWPLAAFNGLGDCYALPALGALPPLVLVLDKKSGLA